MSESSPLPIEIDAPSVVQLLEKQEILLVDCREQNEYEVARIEGALLLPMSQWLEVVAQLDEHRGRRIVVHCHHGVRSLRVTNWLRENGFPEAQSMQGGIDAWSCVVDESVPRY